MNKFAIPVLMIMIINGCQKILTVDGTKSGTLSDRQLAAYPMLDENAYLVLKDFESPAQLDDFTLNRKNGRSRIFQSESSSATGTGSLGLSLDTVGDYTLAFTTPIQRWADYNLFLYAVFSNTDQSAVIELKDTAGKSFLHKFQLHKKSWNKLDVDLGEAGEHIDLNCVNQVLFHFEKTGQTKLFLDDLILVDYRKQVRGLVDGPAGSLYSLIDGRQIRVGANGRFELVFYKNKLIAWYDLSTDRPRSNNLLDPSANGVEIVQIATLRNAHIQTALTGTDKDQNVKITIMGEYPNGFPANQIVTYHIHPDGLILLSITQNSKSNQLGIGVTVNKNRGFDAVIGKIRNPAGNSADNRIEYAIFRRIGKRPGADLLIAFKPWKNENLPIRCQLRKNQGTQGMQAMFVSQANIGENSIQGMMRVWPPDIDHLGNAEIYVRKFLETNWPDFKGMGSSEGWQPTYNLEGK